MKKTLLTMVILLVLLSVTSESFGVRLSATEETIVQLNDTINEPEPTDNPGNGEDKPTQHIPVTDIDIEDVLTPMIIGTSQILSATVIPTGATEKTVTYTSQSPDVASVNAVGRVTALGSGSATIQISAGEITKYVYIAVEAKPVEVVVRVTAIDVDYEDTMTAGTTQQLFPSVLPADATPKISYSSSNSSVATVNTFGRVSAISGGTAKITITADGVSKTISITVKDKIIPTDIDIELSETTVYIGTPVIIGATVLPANAEEQTITYTSSNKSVLTVNELGRVTGIAEGTSTVTLQAGSIKKNISLKVEKEIVVSKIEVEDYKEKMKIDDTQKITAALYPTDAKDQKITYSSSDPEIASISEGGTITAISKGEVIITIAVGETTKELELKVYVETKKIQLPDSYLVMQPSHIYRVFASVSPNDADQDLVYRSTNERVATVSENGTVTAHSPGKASIIVSNDDSTKAVTVIVNEGVRAFSVANDNSTPENEQILTYSQMLLVLMQEAEEGESITVSGAEYSVITKEVLRALYQTSKWISVYYDDYIIRIHGTSIRNAENALITGIYLTETDLGLSFTVNDKRNLPGSVEIEFLNWDTDYQYLYMLEHPTQKYVRLNALNGKTVEINLAGDYLLSTLKLNEIPFGIFMIIAAVTLVIFCTVAYVLIRKKHLFW